MIKPVTLCDIENVVHALATEKQNFNSTCITSSSNSLQILLKDKIDVNLLRDVNISYEHVTYDFP